MAMVRHLAIVLLALCVIVPFISCGEAVGELKIEVLYKPDTCEKKSEPNALLTMHYTGTLLDGRKFDSR
jgi:FK506-binding protein 14